MSLSGATDFDKLKELCTLNHKEQVIWFLNSFWHKHAEEAELLWKYQHKFAELDLQNHEAGCDLDELNAHRFLEFFNETMTVRQMRDTLRATGAIGDKFKNVPITHYLIYRYSADWKYLVNASQGDNKAEIEQAQRMLEAVQAAYKESEAKAQAAAAALREAQAREAEAKAREAAAVAAVAEAKLREEESHAAKAELEVALAEVQKQEDAYNNKKADLERKSEEGGVVSRNKAKAELAQHLAEDPLPLRRAKINQEAAVKKAERATIAAAAAVEASVVARANAEEATRQSEAATRQSAAAKAAAEEAVREAEARVAEAEAFLNEVKKKPGQAQGAIWWIEREIQETRNYLPESKGGVRRK